MNSSKKPTDLRAAGFLALAAFLAYGGLRIASLGFYREDWLQLWIMSSAGTRFGVLRALAAEPLLLRRPLDVLLSAVPFWVFGARPLGWHIVLAVLNTAGAFVVYRILKAFRVRKTISLLMAAAFLVYPSKDTALYWSGYINGPLAFLTFFYGYWLHLDYIERPRLWKPFAACASMIISFSGYDSCLFLLPILLVTPKPATGQARARLLRSTMLLVATTAAVIVMRLIIIRRLGEPSYIKITVHHAFLVYLASLNANFGPDLIASTLTGIAHAFQKSPFVAAAAFLAPALTLIPGRIERSGDAADDRSALWKLIGVGAAVYILGYLVIAISPYLPAPTAEENRLNLVPAAGIVFALGGWFSLRRRKLLADRLAALLAALAISASVGFSASWVEASVRQMAVRDLLFARRGQLPHGDSLFLRLPELHVDGHASVFDHELFFNSAVHLWTKDTELRAFLLRPGVEFTSAGLRLDGKETFPYDRLSILDAGSGVLTVHPSYADCRLLSIPPYVHNPFVTRVRALLGLQRPSS